MVVNLRVPMSWTGLTSLVPGLSDTQAARVSEALRVGERDRIPRPPGCPGRRRGHQRGIAPTAGLRAGGHLATTAGAPASRLGLLRHADSVDCGSPRRSPSSGRRSACWPCPSWPSRCCRPTPSRSPCWAPSSSSPFILFSLPAGAWVDRLRRRPILITADVGRAVCLGWVPIAWELGVLSIEQLYVVGFVTGVLTVFFDVSYQSYLPT